MHFKDKIVVKFTGGFGNQLFQYAFYKWLEFQYPTKRIEADLSEYKLVRPHGSAFAWEVIENAEIKKASFISIFLANGQIPIFYGGKGGSRINQLRENVNSLLFHSKGIFLDYKHNFPSDIVEAINSDEVYIEGFWQNYLYYDFLKQNGHGFKFIILDNIQLTEEVKSTNAVSVHVRRGDYIGSEFEKDCTIEYYNKAIYYFKEKLGNPFFYFFSDDSEYVEKEFCWLSNKKIINTYSGKKSYYDMYLMSLFHNSIIANSTFSVWAAYLNKNVEPTIIYPKVEFMKRMVKNTWIGIDVENVDFEATL